MNILYLSGIDWSFIFQRPQQIASLLADMGIPLFILTLRLTDPLHYVIVGFLRRKAIINRRLLTLTPVNYFGSKSSIQCIFVILDLLFLKFLVYSILDPVKLMFGLLMIPIIRHIYFHLLERKE